MALLPSLPSVTLTPAGQCSFTSLYQPPLLPCIIVLGQVLLRLWISILFSWQPVTLWPPCVMWQNIFPSVFFCSLPWNWSPVCLQDLGPSLVWLSLQEIRCGYGLEPCWMWTLDWHDHVVLPHRRFLNSVLWAGSWTGGSWKVSVAAPWSSQLLYSLNNSGNTYTEEFPTPSLT